MTDNRGTTERIKPSVEESTETVYYTIKGKEDRLENGYPVQDEENQFTYAKSTGVRRLLRIDDRGEFINPYGLFPQKNALGRFVPVSEEAFNSYLDFLRTKNQKYFLHTQRNVR